MIHLTKAGLTGSGDLVELANQFEQLHSFCLPRLLDPELMEKISAQLKHCEWITREDGTIAKEAVPSDLSPANVLNFVANTSEFLDLMRRVTNCHSIMSFGGRIYRMEPGADHFDSWHADLGTTHCDRLVGMSINLSPRPYQGGVFRLRNEASAEILCELSNTGPGDAIFFRISSALRHMVTTLVGTEPKTAFAGWFRSGKTDFYSTLRPGQVASPD
jgi:hypothetical protein